MDDFPQNPEPLPQPGAEGFVLNNDTQEFVVREKLTAGAVTLTGLGNSGVRSITAEGGALRLVAPSMETVSDFNVFGSGTQAIGMYSASGQTMIVGGGAITSVTATGTAAIAAPEVKLDTNVVKIGTGLGGFPEIQAEAGQSVALKSTTIASLNAPQTDLYGDTVLLGKGIDSLVGRTTVASRGNTPLDITVPDLNLKSSLIRVGETGPTAVISSKTGQDIFISQQGQIVLPDGGSNNKAGLYLTAGSGGIYGGDALNNVIVDNTGVIGSNFVDNLNSGFGGFISQTREGENLFALPANDIIHNGALSGNNVTFLLGGQLYHRQWTRPGWYELFTQNITGTDQPIGITVKRAGLYKITWCCNSSSEAKLTCFRPGENRFNLDGTTVNNTPNITIEFLLANDTIGMAFTGGATCVAAGTYMLIERVAGVPGAFTGVGRGGTSTSTNYR